MEKKRKIWKTSQSSMPLSSVEIMNNNNAPHFYVNGEMGIVELSVGMQICKNHFGRLIGRKDQQFLNN